MTMSRAWFVAGSVTIVASSLVFASQGRTTPVNIQSDTSVRAYTSFVDGTKLTEPVDRELVVALLDRLACAVEGLALARQVETDDAVLDRVHTLRRDVRRLASTSSDAPEILKQRSKVFTTVAELMITLNRSVNPKRAAERSVMDALARSADGLDSDYPLRWQPDNLNMFFRLAAEGLQHIERP
jgi:hypothetical protein